MRIAIVQPFGRFSGHYSTYTHKLVENLASLEEGLDVTVISSDGFSEDWPARIGVRHEQAMPLGGRIPGLVDRRFGYRWPAWAARTLAVVNRSYCDEHEWDLVHILDATWSVMCVQRSPFRQMHKTVLTIAGSSDTNSGGERPRFLASLREIADFRVVTALESRGAAVVVHSEGVRDWLEKNQIVQDVPAVIPWGVSVPTLLPDRASSREKLGLGGYSGDILLAFGHVRPVKGIEDAIRGLSCLNSTVKMLVVGPCSEDYGHTLRALISLSGRARIDFRPGYVSNDDVMLYHRAADAVLLTYRDFHGASGALSQAIEAGVPVIASECGQIGQFVRKHELGILCQPGDAESIGSAIGRFLGLGAREREKYASNVVAFGRQSSWASVARRHLDLYRTKIAR